MKESYWHATARSAQQFPALQDDIEADVAIIGAGITGLTCALHLKQLGKKVVILEALTVASGCSGGTSGHLDTLPDQGPEKLINDFGLEGAQQLTLGRAAAIDQIETWSKALNIDCDFQRIPAFAYTHSAQRQEKQASERESARKLGLKVSELIEIPAPYLGAVGYRIDNQARFHPVNYLNALAAAVNGDGSSVYEYTRALPPDRKKPHLVKTKSGATVKAENVIVATHSSYLGISQLDFKLAPYQSYVLVATIDGPSTDALFWDDADPYHYTRVASGKDASELIIGGADHKTGQASEATHLDTLEQFVRDRFTVLSVSRRWSAEYFEPIDGVPFIGRVPFAENLFIAAGYSGTGLTYGTMAGQVLSDLISGRENNLSTLLSPARLKPAAGGVQLVVENANVIKHFVGDRFNLENVNSLDSIVSGQGKVVRYNGDAVAVYRDLEGQLHSFSPTCTHAGCQVKWNTSETTWDCPCHGGRFAATGERIYGPPAKDLVRKNA